MSTVQVAVGVILREDQVFICKRPSDKHQGGKWEFPGGKVDDGETAIEALRRELKEEVGITVLNGEPLVTVTHDYGDKRVCLEVFTVSEFTGEPAGLEGQDGLWCVVNQLDPKAFPDANVAIIDALLKH
ncbi:8-oxo-dGTP diphosphatase MutT [Alteromonas sp. 14N.309.X.WAT.G.H12]|uniref:8-oxo-dGTP diphosphatase MutT n=1 Tax=Alteromonas sp. 14N.309.X.WAT.G.H12 TaxID=3120824 RepID=UPI002FD094EE